MIAEAIGVAAAKKLSESAIDKLARYIASKGSAHLLKRDVDKAIREVLKLDGDSAFIEVVISRLERSDAFPAGIRLREMHLQSKASKRKAAPRKPAAKKGAKKKPAKKKAAKRKVAKRKVAKRK